MPSCAEKIRRNSKRVTKKKNAAVHAVCGHSLGWIGPNRSNNFKLQTEKHHSHSGKKSFYTEQNRLPYIKNKRQSFSKGSAQKVQDRQAKLKRTYHIVQQNSLAKNTCDLIKCYLFKTLSPAQLLSSRLVEVYGLTCAGKRTLIHCLMSPEKTEWNAEGEMDTNCLIKYKEKRTIIRFRNMEIHNNESSSRDVDACLVIFSVSDRTSFQNAMQTVQDIRNGRKKDTPIFLVANRNDTDTTRKISTNEIVLFAMVYDCTSVETSFYQNYNVYKLLKKLLSQTSIGPHKTIAKHKQESLAGSAFNRIYLKCRGLFHLRSA